MTQVPCDHCGRAIRVRRVDEKRDYFCCAGCALRARVPIDREGNYPVNGALVSALVVGFLYFNQLLDWGLAALVAHQGKAGLAQRFTAGGATLAIMVWLGLVWLEFRAGPPRGKDLLVGAVTLALIVSSFRSVPPSLGLCVSANAVLLVWVFRGIFRPSA